MFRFKSNIEEQRRRICGRAIFWSLNKDNVVYVSKIKQYKSSHDIYEVTCMAGNKIETRIYWDVYCTRAVVKSFRESIKYRLTFWRLSIKMWFS